MRATPQAYTIEVLRVLCITSMTWVHVSPGLHMPSVVSTGAFAVVGTVLGDIIGRASVAALSFVSGYLLWLTAHKKPFADFVEGKLANLMIPMILWSLIYIGLAVGKTLLTHERVAGLNGAFDSPWAFFNAATGFAGPTANYALFFIRDLFVSLILLRLCANLVVRLPWLALILAVGVTLFGLGAPVIFRPSILLFATAGMIWAARRTLADLTRPAFAFPVAGVAAFGWLLLAQVGAVRGPLHMGEDILMRITMTALAFWLAGVIASSRHGGAVAGYGRHMYLSYLMHIPLVGVLWTVWTQTVGGPDDASYLIFYLSMPFVAVAAGTVCGRMLDQAPGWLQSLLRGKAVAQKGGLPAPAPA